MKQVTDIVNNLLITNDVEVDQLNPIKTFYVEIIIFSNKNGNSKELYVCDDLSVFDGKKLYFNKSTGYYICIIGDSNYINEIPINKLGRGRFPYIRPGKNYSCFNALKEFKEAALTQLPTMFPLAGKSLKYSFGLEFETSEGLLPEEECYKHGLIPLHDGSISGIEYTTIVMEKPYALTLLRKQLDILKANTHFSKNCALHIHFGGYPVDIKAVYLLYLVCTSIENDLRKYNCPAVFQTDMYKDNGKNYCNAYNKKVSFADFCYAMSSGNTTEITNLTTPHPSDNSGTRKWEINIRYFWVNFINILFYNRAKTIEFRFLRPTYNYNKIVGWLYLFNAILLYSEKTWKNLEQEYNKYRMNKLSRRSDSSNTSAILNWNTFYLKNIQNSLTLKEIVSVVYEGTSVLPRVIEFLNVLARQAENEAKNKDIYGAEEVKTDDVLFTTNISNYDS